VNRMHTPWSWIEPWFDTLHWRLWVANGCTSHEAMLILRGRDEAAAGLE
jgi:hypothetical protein